MEAESTKDSFGWMTHFYLQAVNYCPATECKCVVENRFLVSLSIGQKRRWCVCVCVCVRSCSCTVYLSKSLSESGVGGVHAFLN